MNLLCNYNKPRHFDYYDNINEVPEFLNQLLPLIDSINSIHFFDDQALSFDLIHEKFAEKFFATKNVSINYEIVKDPQKVELEFNKIYY